ncbi:hypothetical protein BN975_01631 [Mycolicibacterium farcinogenes]|nr:hypothetical protein BN975_01631 [Mycolicibacterium farcinogenes]
MGSTRNWSALTASTVAAATSEALITSPDCTIDAAPAAASGFADVRTASSSGVSTPNGHTQLTPTPSSP